MQSTLDSHLIEQQISSYEGDIAKVSKKALEIYAQLGGIPTKKNEAYKYGTLYNTLSHNLSAELPKKEFLDLKSSTSTNLYFENGCLNTSDSTLSSNVQISIQLNSEIQCEDPYECINLALVPLSYKLQVPKNAQEEIHIFHTGSTDSLQASSLKIEMERGSELFISESFLSLEKEGLKNTLTVLDIKENATCTYIKDTQKDSESNHVGKLKASLQASAKLHSFNLSVGLQTSRHNIEVDLNGENAEVFVDGIYLLEKDQEADHYSIINHNTPHSFSHQLFKGIVKDQSHAIFTGKILVKQDSQLIESEQLNKSIILSSKAKVNTRPQLEVYADDVKCAHGATIGQLDEEELFYLQSRAINRTTAFQMVCKGFLLEVVERVTHKKAKEYILEKVHQRLRTFDFQDTNEVSRA